MGIMGGFIALSLWAFLLIGYVMIPDLIWRSKEVISGGFNAPFLLSDPKQKKVKDLQAVDLKKTEES